MGVMKFLQSLDGNVEYAAWFLVGRTIEAKLEIGKIYGVEEFKSLKVEPFFIKTQSTLPISRQEKMKWRCIGLDQT